MASARILVVCTANVCRSPMAAGFLAARLHEVGVNALVESAGIRPTELGVDPDAVLVAAELGLDISGHRPRRLTRELVDEEGADLVVTMTRRHVREVAVSCPNSFARTFALRELRRRLSGVELAESGARLGALVTAISVDRRPSQLLADCADDDIADPYGTGPANIRRTARELGELAHTIAVGLSFLGDRGP